MDRTIWGLFFAMVAACLWQYSAYLAAIIPLDYDWDASDGDHLNFAHRLAQGLPIYFSSTDGQFLSIYTPLYHAVVALLGGADASMVLARGVSLIFWLLCPALAYWYARNKWGRFHAAILAIFVFLPPQPRMLFEIVSINGNSLMACLFLLTLIAAERLPRANPKSWAYLMLLGGVAALCFFAKQQGLAAIATVAAYLLIRERSILTAAWCMAGFVMFSAAAIVYLEIMNHENFLRATIVDLGQVMTSSASLSIKRLAQFLVKNWAFTIVSGAALYGLLRKRETLNIWHVSLVMHIPLLLKILGNEGGGETYFLTFWMSMAFVAFGHVMKNVPKESVELTPGPIRGAGPMVSWGMFFLCLNLAVGASHSVAKSLGEMTAPDAELEARMYDYFGGMRRLAGQKQDMLALSNRNIGALVNSGIQTENEGCTTFSYAWQSPRFDRETILRAIRARKYDLISTGLTPYPEDVLHEIEANYKPVLTARINLNRGREGSVTVYTRK